MTQLFEKCVAFFWSLDFSQICLCTTHTSMNCLECNKGDGVNGEGLIFKININMPLIPKMPDVK